MVRRLEQLVDTTSQLAGEVIGYLDALAKRAAELPRYYPARLRAASDGKTPFDPIRQMVRAVDRRSLERYLAEDRERLLASGRSAEREDYRPHRAYAHRSGRPEDASDDSPRDRDKTPAPPPAVPWDEHAGEKFHRAVVLGDPGCGKTWLCRFEARRLTLAAKKGLEDHAIGLDDVVLPILTRLSNLKAGRGPLETALVNFIGKNRSARFRRYVTDRIASGHSVIILDAWDEVQPAQALRHRIEAFAQDFPGPRLLLTSRIVGYDSAVPPISQAQELELLAFEPPEIDAFIGAWFAGEADGAREFQAMLAREHQVRGLARIPLMLTLMCRVFVDCREKKRPFPTRRVELYDLCLRGLIRDWWAYDDKPAIRQATRRRTNTYVNAVIGLLQDCALSLFAEGAEQFPEADLEEKMESWLGARKRPQALSRRDAGSLIEELKQDGIFIAANDDEQPPLLFLHRTFQEYLAAGALAARLNDPKQGWDSRLTLAGHDWKMAEFVDKKAWDPAWAEVITLMAGQLREPHAVRLLEMLSDSKPTATNPCGDDLLRHRLGLAALCLAELRPTALHQCSSTVDEVTTAAFALWQEHQRRGTADAVPHLARALPSLALANGRVAGTPLLDCLCQMLRSGGGAGSEAEDALGEMGEAAARHPDVLPALIHSALHGYFIDSGARALGRMSEAAARHPDVLPALDAALQDTDSEVRWRAAAALGKMGKAATLHDTDSDMCGNAAANALGRMTEVPAPDRDALQALVAALHDTDSEVRWRAALALRRMGEAAARHPEVLPALMAALHDTDSQVRWRAAEALPRIMAQGVRILQDAPGRWKVWTVAELSRWQQTPAGPPPQAPRDGL